MPHCIIEYAAPLKNKISVEDLVDIVFTATAESGLFDVSSIKARAIEVAYFKTGATEQNFVTTTIKLLPGRTVAQKKALGEAVLAVKQSQLKGKALLNVEVVDLAEAYFK
ncbi:5-carboxymethyl-2-hydroxymuconate Delta-isomerase [Kiloniella laminariae]|uniref:5-carboxymethyl-2-hydroxymuconate Delta-isomerase n=1 Tax=Kiloniella laminariae TaxID=454162 RepID=A0ABT4LN05_9PROT|nr:5-carboxymethyl-2-hydroxymuconate Delta-isomerase [Kiloniella laminariae]MCZ4282467.1 5-carboxymethyl-2-hydroxymuconate Delta-isomerase [Kiloniella laminariae]